MAFILTIIALTMSYPLLRNALTAFARDTPACDMTRSMSSPEIPVSSICSKNKTHQKTFYIYHN